jgi:hypothetical protein
MNYFLKKFLSLFTKFYFRVSEFKMFLTELFITELRGAVKLAKLIDTQSLAQWFLNIFWFHKLILMSPPYPITELRGAVRLAKLIDT